MGILSIFKTGPRIIELTSHNFETVIYQNPYLLVNFYSPYCRYCRRFAPEYEKTAKLIYKKKKPVTVARIDAANETTIANQQGIDRYPTVKFFKNTIPFRYDGPQESSDMYKWLEYHIGR